MLDLTIGKALVVGVTLEPFVVVLRSAGTANSRSYAVSSSPISNDVAWLPWWRVAENSTELPEGLVLTRTTPVFDNDTVPVGLLRAHRLANDVWGRLVVLTGVVRFVFDDDSGDAITLTAGCTVTIPPQRPHHVDLRGYSTFTIEFWKRDQND